MIMMPVDFAEVAARLREHDACYQVLFADYKQKLEDYNRIMDTLSYEDRCNLDGFMTACKELEERNLELLVHHYAIHGAAAFKNSNC